jgi:hypothetical protein
LHVRVIYYVFYIQIFGQVMYLFKWFAYNDEGRKQLLL